MHAEISPCSRTAGELTTRGKRAEGKHTGPFAPAARPGGARRGGRAATHESEDVLRAAQRVITVCRLRCSRLPGACLDRRP